MYTSTCNMVWFTLALGGTLLATALVIWQWWRRVDVKDFYAGKRIILTGASRGLGREMAVQLAQLRARLVISARSEDLLTQTLSECQTFTPDVFKVVGDMGLEGDCVRLVDTAVEQLGGLDILIINAAYTPDLQWFSSDKDLGGKFLNAFRVNVMQAVHLTSAALLHLTTSHGSIIAISSGAAIAGIPKATPYGTSKHALQGFFKALHQEFVMTAVPVSITIMPLPYILTDRAMSNWRPIGNGMGFTVEDCSRRVLQAITRRRMWCTIDWSSYLMLHLYSLWPELFDTLTRAFVYFTSSHYANITKVL